MLFLCRNYEKTVMYLQDLEVLNVFMLQVRPKLNLFEDNRPRE